MSEEHSSKHNSTASFETRRTRLFGMDSDQLIKSFFGLNATVAIVILLLITIFLFKEGAGFVGMYRNSLQLYRLSGLEYIDILKEEREAYTQLSRYQGMIRSDWIKDLRAQGKTQEDVNATINTPDARAFFMEYRRVGSDLRSYVQEKMELAIELRDQYLTNQNFRDSIAYMEDKVKELNARGYQLTDEDRAEFIMRLRRSAMEFNTPPAQKEQYAAIVESLREGQKRLSEAERKIFANFFEEEKKTVFIEDIDSEAEIKVITSDLDELKQINDELAIAIQEVLDKAPAFDDNPMLAARIKTFKELNAKFIQELPKYESQLANWQVDEQVSSGRAVVAFLTGKDWITASDQQDWYGLIPLFTGSLLIAVVALTIAVPFGVGAAVYVNQIAGAKERNFVKPYIEFIEAIPSVVIGFFGVMVLGQFVREWSQQSLEPSNWPVLGLISEHVGIFNMLMISVSDLLNWVASWLPFFPEGGIQERLNAFTAGCLLALMAIPTIFTLSEDAINNVPRYFKEASFAMGATRLQTTVRVIVPTALSGIISAVMLGFGRVIGETMVVLLCAGNRISIPDFTEGMGVFFQPVHTMTGIIAQEMGEVVPGSLHYRALFMVGIVLFFLSLLINISAQWVVRKYRKIGD